MKGANDISRLLASPKATAALGAVILVFLIGIGIYLSPRRTESRPPDSAVVAAFGQPSLAEQSESDRKTLESLPPSDVAPPTAATVVTPGNVAATVPAAVASPSPSGQAYTVVGLEPGDALNVRRGPGVQNPVIARLPIAYNDVELTGAPVSVGSTVWVPVKIGTLSGWVARKNLSP